MLDLTRGIRAFDRLQQKHHILSFPIAVMKKYGDDRGGNLAALITYYGFIAFFPAILLAFSIIGVTLRGDAALQHRIISSLLEYFPVVGQQLQANIHTIHRSGLSYVFEVLIILYGSRGVASAVQHAFNDLWQVDKHDRPDYLHNLLRSFGVVIFGGIGLILTTSGLSYATGIGTIDNLARSGLFLLAFLVNILTFFVIFRLATSQAVIGKNLILGAIVAAFFWQLLQALGSFLILHELKQASALYGIFAVVLGLVFWLYLQAQFTIYAVEINVVRVNHLWPRKIS